MLLVVTSFVDVLLRTAGSSNNIVQYMFILTIEYHKIGPLRLLYKVFRIFFIRIHTALHFSILGLMKDRPKLCRFYRLLPNISFTLDLIK